MHVKKADPGAPFQPTESNSLEKVSVSLHFKQD